MVIEKISISGFKNIKKEIEMDFTVDKMANGSSDFDDFDIYNDSVKIKNKWYKLISSIIGPNAAGKTSIIEAITFAMTLINNDSIANALKHDLHRTNLDTRFKMGEIPNEENIEIDEFKHLWIDQFKEMFNGNISSLKNINSKEGIIKITTIDKSVYRIVFDNNDVKVEVKYKNKSQTYSYISLATNVITNMKIDSIIDNNNEVNIKEFLPNFKWVPAKVMHINSKSIENITKVVSNLLKIFGEKKLVKIIQQIDHGVSGIDIKNKRVTFISDKENSFSLQSLSDGTKKILILLNQFTFSKDEALLLIDEIENGMHLMLIKIIHSIWTSKDINKKLNQVIFTTHNRHLFTDEFNKSNVFVVGQKNNDFETYNADQINLAKSNLSVDYETFLYSIEKLNNKDRKKLFTPKNIDNPFVWSLLSIDQANSVKQYNIDKILEVLNENDRL